jgi:hypothetical protein
MKPSGRLFFLLLKALLCVSLSACAGFPPGNRAGAPVFTGVSSGHYLSTNRAVTLALQDAARRVSFFHSVEARIKYSEAYNPQFRLSHSDEEKELIYDTDYDKYIRFLEFDPERDVFEENGSLFIRTQYTGEAESPAHYRPAVSRGGRKPSWIDSPPAKIGGSFCAVGYAGPRLSHKDAVIASYENAVYALVQNNFYKVYASQQVYGSTMLDTAAAFASGIVKGFYVLETWTDPKTGVVWTLASAREVNHVKPGE